jgi:2-oxoglutarate ferredoxin oxidoreductase subunit gamma
MKKMRQDIIAAGFGGQGIMLLGKLIAQAGMLSNLHVTWIPKYGAEVRGGTAHCMVRVSTDEIANPLISRPNAIIVMNKPSLAKFEEKVIDGGVIIVNSSLCDVKVRRKEVRSVYVPATEIANMIGDVKGANMVCLGALLKAEQFLELSVVVAALKDILPSYRHKYIPLNEKALYEGYNHG